MINEGKNLTSDRFYLADDETQAKDNLTDSQRMAFAEQHDELVA
jgi:hypothetical protein